MLVGSYTMILNPLISMKIITQRLQHNFHEIETTRLNNVLVFTTKMYCIN